MKEELEQLKQKVEELEDVTRQTSDSFSTNLMRVESSFRDPTLIIPLSNRNKQAINTQVIYPVTISLVDGATAANYDVFYINDNQACEVVEVIETHRVLGTDAGAVTVDVEKLTSGQALDAGVTLLVTALSLKTTINTPQFGTLKATDVRILRRGDRLALKDTGTLTAVAGLNVTIFLRNI